MARVLIIEDDPSLLDSLRDLLTLAQLECSVAASAEQGLAIFKADGASLVVCDVQLPDMTGYQVCQLLKRDGPSKDIPVVLMSGRFTESEDIVQGIELGASDFFTKPFDPRFFIARLKSLLRPPPAALQN